MKNKTLPNSLRVVAFAPPVVGLLNAAGLSLLSNAIREHPATLHELTTRRKLLWYIESYYSRVPVTTPIEHAIQTEVVGVLSLSNLYNALADFLELDEYHHRLIIYLPFELIPHRQFETSNTVLNHALKRFMSAYKLAWETGLRFIDFRRNYTDGDVDAEEIPDMVCKSAHIAAVLIAKGYLHGKSLYEYVNRCIDPIVSKSLLEAIHASDGIELGPIDTRSIATEHSCTSRSLNELLTTVTQPDAIQCKFDQTMDARERWICQTRNAEFVLSTALIVAKYICSANIDISEVTKMLQSGAEPIIMRILIRSLWHTSSHYSLDDHRIIRVALVRLLDHDNAEVSHDASTVLRLLSDINSIDAVPGLIPAVYDSPFSDYKMHNDAITAIAIAEEIASNPVLSQHFYPVISYFGSQIKGYARPNSDKDIGVFVRGVISEQNYTYLHSLIIPLLEKFGISETLFFSDTSRYVYHVREATPEEKLIQNLWIGIWCGDQANVAHLQNVILSRNLLSTNPSTRFLIQNSTEFGQLQYRLMHSGYASLFAPKGGISGPNTNEIDGNTTFWDSGFRRLATQLFVSRIVFPDYTKPI